MNISRRKIEALRNLAERPGTEAEGAVARAMLERMEGRAAERDFPVPKFWPCPCGTRYSFPGKCSNVLRHLAIQTEIRARFVKGDRVFYNRWAYSKNSQATVVGYVKLKPEKGTHPWAWIILKFDYLKSSRQVPIYSRKGWHLSHAPLPDREAAELAGP